VTFTATVAANGSGAGKPGGSVTFKDGTTVLGLGTVDGAGQATFTTSSLSADTHSITAQYSGDGNFSSSTSAALNQLVNQAGSTTVLTSSLSHSSFDQSLTFTATVGAEGPGAGNPGGTVTFKDGTTVLGLGTLNSSGQASFTTSNLPVGTHNLTAQYSGDSNFSTSTSAALNQVVSQVGSTTILTSSLSPSAFGQSVTFTAIVGAKGLSTASPDGNVTFKDGTVTLGSGTLNAGRAAFTVKSLSLGTHRITAQYTGSANFTASASAALSQIVERASTIKVSSSSLGAVFGQTATFTATVSVSGAGTPTGTVTFLDGTRVLGTRPVSGGKAALSLSNLTVGTHSISVRYSGNSTFAASTSTALKQNVALANTQTTVVASAASVTAGQSVIFTAIVGTVAPGNGVPTGSITFVIDGVSQAPVALDANGKATLTRSNLAVGRHAISANYTGSLHSNGSQPVKPLVQIVEGPATHLATSVSPSLSVGVTVPFSVSVNALDALNQLATAFHGTAKIVLVHAPSGGIVSGLGSVKFVKGVAKFLDLEVNETGNFVVEISSGNFVTTLTLAAVGRQT
jgi:hypothetical protein